MSLPLQKKYIQILGPRFPNFKRRSQSLFVFSCPVCGDSEKSSRKARGNFFERNGEMCYHCYNCGVTMTFKSFFKRFDQAAFLEYTKEKLLDERNLKPYEEISKPRVITNNPLVDLQKVSSLKPDHVCRQYVANRHIPRDYWGSLYYAEDFPQWVNNKIQAEKFRGTFHEPRLVIPLIDKNKTLHGVQGRALGPSEVRYISIITNETIPPVWGLDRVHFNSPTPVMEGPIKAMFVENGISACGGSIEISVHSLPMENLIICYDNEPRKLETCKKMYHALEQGYKVCLWPSELTEKDADDMVNKQGYSVARISQMIRDSAVSGMSGIQKFNNWKRVRI